VRAITTLVAMMAIAGALVAAEKEDFFPGVRSRAFVEGDFDALLDVWVKTIEENPDSYEALMALRLIRAYADYMRDWRRVEGALEKALESPLKCGYAYHRYRQALVSIYESRGLTEKVERMRPCDGAVVDFWYVGSFGWRMGAGAIYAAWDPEKATLSGAADLLKQEYCRPRDGVVLRWIRTLHHEPPLSDSVSLRTRGHGGVNYALAQFRLDAARPLVLDFGPPGGGALIVWFNGVKVFEHDPSRRFGPHALRVCVAARAGWNVVLVKTERSGLSLWLRDTSGRPLPAVCEKGRVYHAPGASGARGTSGEKVTPDLLEHYRALASAADAPLDAKLAYLWLLCRTDGMEVEAEDLAGRLIAARPDDALVRLFAAEAYRGADHCPDAWRQSRQNESLEAALKIEPRFVLAVLAKAETLVWNDKEEEAVRLMEELITGGVRRVYLYMRVADVCGRMGWEREELRAVKEAERLDPNNEAVLTWWENYYRRRRNPVKARSYERRSLELYSRGDALALFDARCAEEEGRFEDALKVIQKFVERCPERVDYRERLAGLLVRLGRGEQALRVWRTLLEQFADVGSPREWLVSIAETERMLGRTDRVVSALRQANLIEFEWDTHRYAQFLAGESEDFFEGYALGEREVDALLKEKVTAEDYPRSPVVELLNEQVILVRPSGSTSAYARVLVKVLREEGKMAVSQPRVGGEVLDCETITPDGKRYDPTVLGERGGGGFVMDKIDIGSVVHVRWRDDGGSVEGTSTQFYEQDFGCHRRRIVIVFQKPQTTRQEKALLKRLGIQRSWIHDRMKLRTFNIAEDPDVAFHFRDTGKALVYEFEARGIRALEAEHRTPPPEEVIPCFDWIPTDRRPLENMAALAAAFRDEGSRPTPLVEREARRIVEGAKDLREKVKKLYEFCHTEIRTSGFGLFGFGAGGAHSILLERAGDRTTLFRAFLNALGIPYRIALCMSDLNDGERIDIEEADVASLFGTTPSYLIVDLPDGPLYVSLRYRYLPLGMLDERLHGAPAIIVSEKEPRKMVFMPRFSIDRRAGMLFHFDVDVGKGECKGVLEGVGASSYGGKEQLAQVPRAQTRLLVENLVSRLLTGAKVTSPPDIPDMRKMGTPLRIIFNCKLSALLKPLPDGTYLLDPCLPPLYLQRQLAGKPNRRFPFYLPGSILSVHRTTLRLGDGYRLKGDPAKMSRLIERPRVRAEFPARGRRQHDRDIPLSGHLSHATGAGRLRRAELLLPGGGRGEPEVPGGREG